MKLVLVYAEDAGFNALYMDNTLVIDAPDDHLDAETIKTLVDYGILNAEAFTMRRLPYRYFEELIVPYGRQSGYPESLEELEPYLL